MLGSTGSKELENRAYHEAQDRMALLPNYYRWVARKFRKHAIGRVIELGVGAGYVLKNYLDQVEEVVGIDFNPTLIKRLKENFPQSNVIGREVDLRGPWEGLVGSNANTVVALDVLEHFEDDSTFANKIAGSLCVGGVAVIKVPAQPSLFSAMDEASGHFRRYDTSTLSSLFHKAGFETVELGDMNVFGALSYRRKSKQSTNFSRSLSVTTLRIANATMPLVSTLDYLPMKGLSLVGIFRRCG